MSIVVVSADTNIEGHLGWNLCFIAVSLGTSFVCYRLVFGGDNESSIFSRFKRTVSSRLVGAVRKPLNVGVRRLFTEKFEIREISQNTGHSHPIAAANRTSASFAIDNWISTIGSDVYSISKSARDGDHGQRLYYSTRDYVLPFQNDSVQSADVFKMVDVDYYADVPLWLSYGKPIILYTFVPQSAGGTIPDGHFSIYDDVVTTQIKGGARYEHPLWDYAHDYVTIDRGYGVYVVTIDSFKLQNDSSRRVMALIPSAFIPFPFSMLVVKNPLKRLRLTHGDVEKFNILRTLKDDGSPVMSVAYNGDCHSVTIPNDLFTALSLRWSTSKHKTVADVERYLKAEDIPRPFVLAPILCGLFERGLHTRSYARVTNVGVKSSSNMHYQTLNPIINDDGIEYARELFPPVYDNPALVPSDSYNNEFAAIQGRVSSVLNRTVPPARYERYAAEYVRQLVPKPNCCSPYSVDDIVTRQNKKTQKERSLHAINWLFHGKFWVSAFMKRESYPKITDPRNISSVPTDHTLRLSGYTYALKEQLLKGYKWYVPGKSPIDICDRLQDLVAGHPYALSTDYSRFDGTISQWMREKIGMSTYLRAFGRSAELVQLMSSEYNPKAFTKRGIRYMPGYSRLSGSPLTTDENTIINAFVPFSAFMDAGCTAPEAFERLGMFLGDDGVVVGLPAASLEKSAVDLGLKLKPERVESHHPLTFAGRTFIDPWLEPSSLQDVSRTLRKLHVTVSPASVVDITVARVAKADGYLSIDANTPLVSHICRALKRISGEEIRWEKYQSWLDKDLPWFAKWTGAWPQLPIDDERVWDHIAKETGLSINDLRIYCDRYDAANAIDDFPTRYIHAPRIVEVAAAVGDVVFDPTIPPPSLSSASSVRIRRRHRRNRTRDSTPEPTIIEHLIEADVHNPPDQDTVNNQNPDA